MAKQTLPLAPIILALGLLMVCQCFAETTIDGQGTPSNAVSQASNGHTSSDAKNFDLGLTEQQNEEDIKTLFGHMKKMLGDLEARKKRLQIAIDVTSNRGTDTLNHMLKLKSLVYDLASQEVTGTQDATANLVEQKDGNSPQVEKPLATPAEVGKAANKPATGGQQGTPALDGVGDRINSLLGSLKAPKGGSNVPNNDPITASLEELTSQVMGAIAKSKSDKSGLSKNSLKGAQQH